MKETEGPYEQLKRAMRESGIAKPSGKIECITCGVIGPLDHKCAVLICLVCGEEQRLGRFPNMHWHQAMEGK